jgi:peptidoglycan/xylan/chitin deacetylase (PgdA/CDA1 family)
MNPNAVARFACMGSLAAAYWLGFAGRRARRCAPPRILVYHGIPRRARAAFERQLRYISRCFDVVPLDVLLSAARDPRPGGRPKIALTFDDGLRNNLAYAYPVLARLALTATFFVCPQLAETGEWLWNHEARQRLARLEEAPRARLANELGAAAADTESVVERMKRLPLGERQHAQARLRALTPHFVPTPEEHDAFDVAGWRELVALDPRVVAIGSHTLTHPILTSLTGPALESEIRDSRGALEEKLGREVDTFAYPNGDYDAEALAYVRRHYRIAVASIGDLSPASDPHQLAREPVRPGLLRLVWRLHRRAALPAASGVAVVKSP